MAGVTCNEDMLIHVGKACRHALSVSVPAEPLDTPPLEAVRVHDLLRTLLHKFLRVAFLHGGLGGVRLELDVEAGEVAFAR